MDAVNLQQINMEFAFPAILANDIVSRGDFANYANDWECVILGGDVAVSISLDASAQLHFFYYEESPNNEVSEEGRSYILLF